VAKVGQRIIEALEGSGAVQTRTGEALKPDRFVAGRG